MPSKSPKQAAFMRAVEHNPEFAAKVGVPQSVGAEFVAADQGKALRLAQHLRRDAKKGPP